MFSITPARFPKMGFKNKFTTEFWVRNIIETLLFA